MSAETFLSEGLYEKVLLAPAQEGADSLSVLTGYATPAMLSRHRGDLTALLGRTVALDLIVGMAGNDGLPKVWHSGFSKLRNGVAEDVLRIRYVRPGFAVHSKVYVWSKGGVPMRAFLGSANYTQSGFSLLSDSVARSEVLTEVDAQFAFAYIAAVQQLIDSDDPGVADVIKLTTLATTGVAPKTDRALFDVEQAAGVATLELSLLTKLRGQLVVPGKSGLNWGHRGTRDRNQAYIKVPAATFKGANADFFPHRTVHFQVLTDDGLTLELSSVQSGFRGNAKALSTPLSNAALGAYFRKRLGLSPGEFITRDHLEAYGATSVTFTKLPHELYLMDFSPKTTASGA